MTDQAKEWDPFEDRVVANPADGVFALRKGEELGLPVQSVDWLQQGTIYVFRPSELDMGGDAHDLRQPRSEVDE